MGRYVYEHRGDGLIVDNIMKPLKGAISAAANKAGRAVAKAIGKSQRHALAPKKAKTAAEKATAKAEKSGDLRRRRLQSQMGAPKTPKTPKTPRGRSRGKEAKI